MARTQSSRPKPAYENRLGRKLNKKYLRSVPSGPGVYSVHDKDGRILYVSQSVNLKNKLRGYAGAGPDITSAGMMRILHLATDIHWEKCEGPAEAIKRKNEIIREKKPTYSDQHLKPENYLFIGFSGNEKQLTFELTISPDPLTTEDCYGAFNSHPEICSSYGALLRLFWMINEKPSEMTHIPMALMRDEPQVHWTLKWDKNWNYEEIEQWNYRIRRYLKGTARSLIPAIRDALGNGQEAPIHFMKPMIQNDLRQLNRFYRSQTRRNYLLAQYFKIRSTIIPPYELDEMQALYKKGEK